ncbi:MAG: sugar ABC transporter substrate-binding protein [Microcoleaceae cyanobacterium]
MIKSVTTWKRFGIFTLLGLLLSWTVSCTNLTASNSNDGRQPIEFWTMQLQPQFNDYFNQIIANFEAENPDLKIRWVDVPWSAMESKILASVSANTAPDVVNLNPDFASLLAERNAWLDLQEQVSDEVRSQYLPNIWAANQIKTCQTDCKIITFGLPWYLTTQITIYNQNLFKQAEITQPPTTYEQLAEVAQQIREKTGKYGFFVSFVPEDSAHILQSLVQMGVKLVDDKGKAAFNTLEGIAAFEYWVNLYQNDLIPREVLTQGHRRAIELYQAGEIAILTSGSQFLNAIAINAPDIAKVSLPAPQITGKTNQKTVAVMNVVIPRNSDQPEDALKFALFLTNSTNQMAFAKAANVLPSTTEALNHPYFQTASSEETQTDEARVISAQQLETAEILIPPMENLKQLQKIIYENLQAAMLNQKTIETALIDAETAWNQ